MPDILNGVVNSTQNMEPTSVGKAATREIKRMGLLRSPNLHNDFLQGKTVQHYCYDWRTESQWAGTKVKGRKRHVLTNT